MSSESGGEYGMKSFTSGRNMDGDGGDRKELPIMIAVQKTYDQWDHEGVDETRV